jgi:hypothetical protein
VPRGQRDGSLRPYSRFFKTEAATFLSSSSSDVLTRLSGPRYRPTTFFGSAGNRTRASHRNKIIGLNLEIAAVRDGNFTCWECRPFHLNTIMMLSNITLRFNIVQAKYATYSDRVRPIHNSPITIPGTVLRPVPPSIQKHEI